MENQIFQNQSISKTETGPLRSIAKNNTNKENIRSHVPFAKIDMVGVDVTEVQLKLIKHRFIDKNIRGR